MNAHCEEPGFGLRPIFKNTANVNQDLGALFRFLHLAPFNTTAGFNQHILTPFKNADPDVVPKLQLLVRSVTLRRLKERVLEVELPPRRDIVVRLQFSRDEQKLHDWFEQDSARKVNAVTSGEKLGGHSYARILTAITNLRLICAHGRDLLSDDALKLTDGMTYDNPMEIDDDENDVPELGRNQAYDMLDILDQTDADQCQYCRVRIAGDNDTDEEDEEIGTKHDIMGYMTPCYHVFCEKHGKKFESELKVSTQPSGLAKCGYCESTIRPPLFELRRSGFRAFQDERERMKKDPKLAKKIGSYTGPHTKTKALLADLNEHRNWSLANPTEPPIKRYIPKFVSPIALIDIAILTIDCLVSYSQLGRPISISSKSPSRITIIRTFALTVAWLAKPVTARSMPSTRMTRSRSCWSPSARVDRVSISPGPTKPL